MQADLAFDYDPNRRSASPMFLPERCYGHAGRHGVAPDPRRDGPYLKFQVGQHFAADVSWSSARGSYLDLLLPNATA